MKHFIVEITYKAPLDKIQEIVGEHREFLEIGYKNDMLLMSGPQMPKIGGIVIARAESMEEISEFFENDPYQKGDYAEYKFIEFNPVKNNEILSGWIGTK